MLRHECIFENPVKIYTLAKIPNMPRSIILTLLVGMWLTAAADDGTGIYRTYDDYKRDKLEDVGTYKSHIASSGNTTLVFDKAGEKIKIKCADIWGFRYKGKLFRIDSRSMPVYLASKDTVIYYENGIANLQMLKYNSTSASLEYGFFCYLSKDMGSEIFPINGPKTVAKFRSAHPEFSKLADCIESEIADNEFAQNMMIDVKNCIWRFTKKD